jgi:hypothetical protein
MYRYLLFERHRQDAYVTAHGQDARATADHRQDAYVTAHGQDARATFIPHLSFLSYILYPVFSPASLFAFSLI